jgi:hypothetical protein
MKKFFIISFSLFISISVFSQKTDKGVFDNAVYARLGYAFPGGDLKDAEAITAGAQFEIGTIFYINALKLPEKLKLGIDVTYASISGFANQKMLNEDNKTDSYFSAGIKLGPCLSYNFAGDWIGDVYFKIHPHQFGTGEDENHGFYANGQTKFGTSLGLNIRWKALMLGCEFTSAKYDFEVNMASSGDMPLLKENRSIKLPVTNLSLGVNF